MATKTKAKAGMTDRELYTVLLGGGDLESVVNGQTVEDKLKACIERLDNRNSSKKSGKDSPKYREYKLYRKQIEDYLADGVERESPVIRTELIKLNPEDESKLSNSRVNAILAQCCDLDGSVEKIDNGRNKPYGYKLIERVMTAEGETPSAE